MKKISNYVLAAMLALAAVSCMKENGNPDNKAGTGFGKLTFNLPKQGTGIVYPRTRAGEVVASDNEKKLDPAKITILAYDNLGVFVKKFNGTTITPANDKATIEVEQSWLDNGTATSKTFYLIGNDDLGADGPLADANAAAYNTEAKLKGLLTSASGTTASPVQITSDNGLLLAGRVTLTPGQIASGSTSIKLGRAVARFDIYNDVTSGKVTITRVNVQKANLKGYIAAYNDPTNIPSLSAIGASRGNYAAAKGFNVSATTSQIDIGEGVMHDFQDEKSCFYLYPTLLTADDADGSILYIEGTVGGVTKVFSLNTSKGSFKIEANRRYKISAIDPVRLTFNLEVVDWDYATELEGESVPEFTPKTVTTETNCDFNTLTGEITVLDPAAVFKCEFTAESNIPNLDDAASNTPVITQLWGTKAIKHTISAPTTANNVHTYTITIESDGAPTANSYGVEMAFTVARATFTIRAGVNANSYMFDMNYAANGFLIPIDQAIKAWDTKLGGDTELKTLLASGNWEVVTLWRTWTGNTNAYKVTAEKHTINDGTADQYFAKLNFGSSITNGHNVVMALRSTVDQSILWSWHLWLTDYKPGSDGTAANGQVHQYFGDAFKSGGIYENKYIMDRNFGATATGVSGAITPPTTAAQAIQYHGLMYQWGRKDPFTSANETGGFIKIYDADGVEIAGGVGGFTYEHLTDDLTHIKLGSQNPMNIYQNSTNYDWTAQDNTLWGSHATATGTTVVLPTSTNKSVFDPCPAGWRVPVGGTTATNNPWAGFNGRPSNPVADTHYTEAGNNAAESESGFMSGTAFPFQYYSGGSNSAAKGGWSNALVAATNGRYYNTSGTTAWYPASGYRNNSNGMLAGLGYPGYSWSSSVNNPTTAHGQYFYSTRVGPETNHNRSYIFPLRCIQD